MAEKKQIQAKSKRTLRACCDVYEDDGNIILRLEMPGVTKDKLDIKIDGNELTIHGARQEITETGNILMKEIYEGDFYQKYVIDDTIDRSKINASLEKGLLTVTLGIKESEKPRKINVVAK
ncbi:MAG: Hsp20/alpha crystallin family protein [Spirochaetales bacterium]|nr:Hsp20/alpha crystallin family protein [Spirochaetales bacterium]